MMPISRRPAIPPFYENFQPRTELREEDGALLLIVYLPGYLHEQITFSKDESTRLIRLSGQRPLLNNRRQMFNIAHKVEENYNFDEVKPQFQIGIFTIRILKIITIPPKEEETSKTTLDPFLTPQETNEKRVQNQEQKEETVAKYPLVGVQEEQPRLEPSSPLEPRKDTAIPEKDDQKVTTPGDQSTDVVAGGDKCEVAEGKINEINDKGPDKDAQKITASGDQSTNIISGGNKWEEAEGKINDKAVVDDHTRFMVITGVAVVVIMALGAKMFSHLVGSSKKN